MITVAITATVVFCTFHALLLFRSSRRREAMPARRVAGRPFFVFVLPCMNEGLVLEASLRRLLDLPSANFAVLVIDDASDDGTSDVVRGVDDARVLLLRREKPNAQLGKGAALNAGYQFLLESALLAGRDLADVVLTVVDADGRLQPNALLEVEPYFADPQIAAVQIGVRMHNAAHKRVARMQDMEFVIFTELFQRGRATFGSSGMGGNGQFARMSALADIGAEPWTDCLTEDLDLGLQLLVRGWRTAFCPRTHVSQQAVTSIPRLLRQRTRWFQGHLQCWKRIPALLRSELPLWTALDLVYHLTNPLLVLLMSIVSALFVWALVVLALHGQLLATVFAGDGLLTAGTYVMSFALTPVLAFVYWLRDRHTSFLGSLGLAHVYLIYTYLWVFAGWWAVGRTLRGSRSWAKTTRTVDTDSGETDVVLPVGT